MKSIKVTRPALRYHGGKWRLAPWIIQYFPKHMVYIEPFAGAASVLLRKERSFCEVYNDKDDDIVNVFLQLRNNGQELKKLLYQTPFARSEFKLAHQNTDDPIERARRIIVRSFMGIGTDAIRRQSNGFRADSNRNCSADWTSYIDALDVLVERMQGVIIENRDYEQIIKSHDSTDALFYVDPPYVLSTRTSNHGYSFEMTDADHRDLAETLNSVKGKVVLSGYASELYDELYKDWHRVVRQHWAFFAKNTVEVLWMNFDPDTDEGISKQQSLHLLAE
jgi:DNA adenine methylase